MGHIDNEIDKNLSDKAFVDVDDNKYPTMIKNESNPLELLPKYEKPQNEFRDSINPNNPFIKSFDQVISRASKKNDSKGNIDDFDNKKSSTNSNETKIIWR